MPSSTVGTVIEWVSAVIVRYKWKILLVIYEQVKAKQEHSYSNDKRKQGYGGVKSYEVYSMNNQRCTMNICIVNGSVGMLTVVQDIYVCSPMNVLIF